MAFKQQRPRIPLAVTATTTTGTVNAGEDRAVHTIILKSARMSPKEKDKERRPKEKEKARAKEKEKESAAKEKEKAKAKEKEKAKEKGRKERKEDGAFIVERIDYPLTNDENDLQI